MRRRLKRSTRQHIIIPLLCVFIFGGFLLTAYFLIIGNLKKNYQDEIKVLAGELESKKVYVYKTKGDIKAGSKVTKDLLAYMKVLSEQPQDNFITEEEIGNTALIDIKAGTEVLKSMLTDNLTDSALREAEFRTFLLSSNLKENDVVDIRILYPNGESYIVLSKKTVKNLQLKSSTCFMRLDPEELLRVSGAIVDCFLNEGSKLYTVKYIEPRIQSASLITYTPVTDVIKLIKEDPNVVQKASDKLSESVRLELDNRLSEFYSSYNGEISWDSYGSYNPGYNNAVQENTSGSLTDNGSDSDNPAEITEVNGQDGDKGEEIYYVD